MSSASGVTGILLAALQVAPLHALAQQDDFCNPGYTVGYFNGVFNTNDDTYDALKR